MEPTTAVCRIFFHFIQSMWPIFKEESNYPEFLHIRMARLRFNPDKWSSAVLRSAANDMGLLKFRVAGLKTFVLRVCRNLLVRM